MFAFWRKWFSKVQEPPDPMKYLITGIGNMGAEYDGTRHNIGFDVIDKLASEYEGSWKNEMHGDLSEIRYRGRTLVLLKPSTYVNLSGKAVRYWLQKKSIKQENLLVVVDDMNLSFGKLRLRGNGSDGGHNGLKDINEAIGEDYARLRVGIGNAPKGRHTDFVLGKWSAEEREELGGIIDASCKAVLSFCAIGLTRAIQSLAQPKLKKKQDLKPGPGKKEDKG